MKILAFVISFSFLNIAQAQIEEYSVIFDQLMLKLNNESYQEIEENAEYYLNQISDLWPKVKNKLYAEVDWDKHQNHDVRDIDLYINVLKKSIEMKNDEYTEVVSLKILMKLKSIRNTMGINNYPIDLVITLQSKYQNINKVVNDQKLDLLEWMEFQDLVDEFIINWEIYNCLSSTEIDLRFPNLDKEQHEQSKNKFASCLENFIDSMKSGYRTDFELPCEDLGDALYSLSKLYQFNLDHKQKL